MSWLVQLIKEAFSLLIAVLLGKERERRKRAEDKNEILKDQADIDARPDIPRDELYDRLRDRATSDNMPDVSRSSERSSDDNV